MTLPKPTSRQRNEALAAMLRTLESGGYSRVEPSILQPAEIFLDLSGEELRRRLFLVNDPAGRDLCLRPDVTIPVSRHHIAKGNPAREADYCYLGPVFRHRPGGNEPDEFMQAGIESFGATDTPMADARTVAVGIAAARGLGAQGLSVKLGDPTIFLGFAAALDLPAAWQRRLRAAFGTPGGIEAVLATAGEAPGEDSAYASALGKLDPAVARKLVSEMADLAGIATVGGRSAGEIADRLIERASLAGADALSSGTIDMLSRLASIDATPAEAAEKVASLATEAGIDATGAMVPFAERIAALSDVALDPEKMRFCTAFGRRLDYYSGFIFEATAKAVTDGPVVAGGRYDTLLKQLGAPKRVPGVGCSIWIDRAFAAGGPA